MATAALQYALVALPFCRSANGSDSSLHRASDRLRKLITTFRSGVRVSTLEMVQGTNDLNDAFHGGLHKLMTLASLALTASDWHTYRCTVA